VTAARAERALIVAGRRTPFARAGGALREHDALALSLHALGALLHDAGIPAQRIDALRWGIVVVDPRIPHLARELVLRSALPRTVRAVTVTDNCITGATCVVDLVRAMDAGGAQVAVAGGAESMSNPPLLFRRAATRRLLDVVQARGVLQRAARALRMRPGDFLPDTPAVVEPSTGLTMGEHCEQMVKTWGIARAPQDALALRSHQRAHAASADQRLTREIRALGGLASDALVRTDTDAERLAALAPVFDRGSSGTITAGNSSPLTDGAAALLMMTEVAAERDGVEPLARVADWEFAAIAPEEGLLMAPAIAVPRLLARHRLRLEDLDIVEVHEAFAGQVLCNLAAWEAGWKEPAVGRVDPARLNALGGSIALGHPFAATGIRMLTTAAYQMQRSSARRALVSICGAGATAAALLLERP
jgi:acetyl-CoA acetyltransferase family protein